MPKTFEEWKLEVNSAVIRLCGLSADDLPDWDYRSAYEDRVPPSTAARRAVKSAKEG